MRVAPAGHTRRVQESHRFELPVRVRFDEATAAGHYRASAHLRAMQDVAWAHSAALGFDLPWYRARGRFWLVRCLVLDVLLPVEPGTVLTVTTEVMAMRRIRARRESEFLLPDGTRAAHGLADWIMTTAEGLPARILPELLERFGGQTALDPARVDVEAPPPGASTSERRVAPRDVDPMGHANNAAYADWLDEAVIDAGDPAAVEAVPRRYQLEYLAPAMPGADVVARTWQGPGGWRSVFVARDGAELLRARLAVG